MPNLFDLSLSVPFLDSIPSDALTRSTFQPYYSPFYPASPETTLSLMEVNLESLQLTVLGSAEAEAISGLGAFVSKSTQTHEFVFPRFHLGVAAQFDLALASYQLALSPRIKSFLTGLNDLNAGIIYFSREGHMCEWQHSVYQVTGANLPTTLVLVHHQPAANRFTREAVLINPLNLEGFPLTNLDTLFLCDPVASGMQQVKVIEELDRLKHLPKTIFIIAPMATLFGLQAIASACQRVGVICRAATLASVLDTTEPLHYYSPYPQSVNQVANPKLHQLAQNVFGPNLHRFCIRGNWTGSFWGGDHFPLTESQKELSDLNLTNHDLINLASRLSYQQAQELGISNLLTPYSSRLNQ